MYLNKVRIILKYLFLLFLLFGFNFLSAQLCIDYGVFDNPVCLNCAPDGWENLISAAEMDDPAIECFSNGSESPTGGTAVGLHIGTLGGDEGIQTTITGLVPDCEYLLAFWWFYCTDGFYVPVEFQVIVDGEINSFFDADDWTLVELCVTPTSSEMEIILTGAVDSDFGYINIDDAICNDQNMCCSLKITLDETAEVCPNQELIIDASISSASGSVSYEWTSDPAFGIDFLDDPFTEDPTFLYPSFDPFFSGIDILYRLTVEDDNCERVKEIIISVLPHEPVSFEFEEERFCETDGTFVFPTSSIEGVNGTWLIPSIELDQYVDQKFVNTFIPDPGSQLCPLNSEHCLNVFPLRDINFDFPLRYCNIDDEFYQFPNESLEGISGTWNVNGFYPNDYDIGFSYFTFIPDDPFCPEEIITEIEILQSDSVFFDLPESFCVSSDTLFFPNTSLNGIPGNWQQPFLIPTNAGIVTNLFTPNESNDECYYNYTHQIVVQNSISVSFTLEDTICKTSSIFTYPQISNEGIPGNWTIPSFNPDTLTNNTIESIWSSTDQQSSCISNVSSIIFIEEVNMPLFSIPESICSSDAPFNLPLESDNNITGTWSVPQILPSSFDTIVSVFAPDEEFCASAFVLELVVDLESSPSFFLPDTICENTIAFNLPVFSDNGIEGNWSTPAINPTGLAGQIINSTFLPINDFAEEFNYELFVSESMTPTFNLPTLLCHNEAAFVLPIVSENNIEGAWDQASINPNNIVGNSISVQFIPDDLSCHNPYTYNLEIITDFNLSVNSINPQNCNSTDGVISINSPIVDLEYSIDNGSTWNDQNSFSNLNSGSYQIIVRSNVLSECTDTLLVNLTSPDAPQIEDIIVSQLSSCDDDNAIIEIISSGNNLEYSIDNGNTWQNANVFQNLSAGTYLIAIRDVNFLDCITEEVISIQSIIPTVISNVDFTHPTDCTIENGIITITAQGQNLEFSIDGGLSWSNENLFENLAPGIYQILVRNNLIVDCLAMQDIELNAVQLPIISNVLVTNSSDCQPASGELIIDSSSFSIEYSIDQGNTWQTDPFFSNLDAGQYLVQLRFSNMPNCLSTSSAEIIQLNNEPSVPTINLIQPSDCFTMDGQINIITQELDLEFSIDGGNSWQVGFTFDMLSEGAFVLLYRKVSLENCLGQLDFFLEALDCPCNELTIEYSKTDIFCVDENVGEVNISTFSGADENNYVFNWSNGAQGEQLNNLDDGWYYLTVSYDQNCEWLDSVFIKRYDPLTFILETFDADCENAENGEVNISSVQGGSGNYTYSVEGEIFQIDNNFYNLSPQEYEAFVLDSIGCLESALFDIEFLDNQNISLPSLLQISEGESLFLNPLINESSIDSFAWSPSEQILNPGNLVAEIAPSVTTTYTLEIFYGECSDMRSITIEVLKEKNIYIGSVFSPNGDSNNDRFFIQTSSNESFNVLSFKIFDRWGNLVFDKKQPLINNPDDGWDGYYNNTKVDPGVFVYVIEYLENQEHNVIAGNVTVVN